MVEFSIFTVKKVLFADFCALYSRLIRSSVRQKCNTILTIYLENRIKSVLIKLFLTKAA